MILDICAILKKKKKGVQINSSTKQKEFVVGNKPGDCYTYTMQCKSDRERQIHDIVYIRNLKTMIQMNALTKQKYSQT